MKNIKRKSTFLKTWNSANKVHVTSLWLPRQISCAKYSYSGFFTNTQISAKLSLLPTLYSHIFPVFFFIIILFHMMLVNGKLHISGNKTIIFQSCRLR